VNRKTCTYKLDVDNTDTYALAAFASWWTGWRVGSASCITLLRQVQEMTGFRGHYVSVQTRRFIAKPLDRLGGRAAALGGSPDMVVVRMS